MSKQSKSSDIRTCGNIILFHNLLAYLIQGCHDRLCLADCRWRCHLCFDRSIHDTTSDLFCKNQYISRSAAVVLKDLIRVNESGYAETVFRFIILHRMSPHKNSTGFFYFIRASCENLPQYLRVETIRKSHNVQCNLRFPSHRIYIT